MFININIYICTCVCVCVCVCVRVCVCVCTQVTNRVYSTEEVVNIFSVRHACAYGVATVSSIDKIIGLFCRMSSLL